MGRKNRNARSRTGQTYTSFQALKEPMMQFDLTKGCFIARNAKGGSRCTSDIHVSIVKNSAANKLRRSLSFSINKDIANKIGQYATVGIVKNDMFERMYWIKTDPRDGFKLAEGSTKKRLYMRISIDDKQAAVYERYVGDHKAQYDASNDAYYITTDK